MKKFLLAFAVLAMGTVTFTSCGDDDEDAPRTAVLTFEGDQFSALIDYPQYGGALLYSGSDYNWTDADNTEISGTAVKADWGSFGWGITNAVAISNYIDDDFANDADYMHQLSVPKSNGSANFAIVWGDGATLSFADGNAHVIKSMQVINTTYALGDAEAKQWGSIKAGLGDGYKFAVTVTADNGSTKEIVLAEGNTAIEDWTNVDLSSLGAVKTLTFTFDGTDSGEWGLNTPKYVAIDNVVVEK